MMKNYFSKYKFPFLCLILIFVFLQFFEITSSDTNDTVKPRKKNKDGYLDYEYYKNLNLTEAIEREYDEKYSNDKDKEYYQNIENVESKTRKSKKKAKDLETREREHKEWEEKIQNFDASYLITVMINKNKEESFFEDFKLIPTKIIIAFYVHNVEDKIDFKIFSPKNKLIYRVKGKNRIFHEFNATEPGIHEFRIDNKRFKTQKKITFAIHEGSNVEENLLTNHTQIFNDKLENVESKIKDMHFSQKMINNKYDGHYKLTKQHNNIIGFYSMVEIILMIVIFIFQFLYMKNLIKQAE